MIEIGIDTLGIDAGVPEQEELDAGVSPAVSCQVVGSLDLPFAQQGSDQPMRIPSVVLRFKLTKQAAAEYGDLLKAKAEQLPDERTSSVLTAQSMREVGRMAEQDQRLRGN